MNVTIGSEALLLAALNACVGVVGWYLRRLITKVEQMNIRITCIEAALKGDTDFRERLHNAA